MKIINFYTISTLLEKKKVTLPLSFICLFIVIAALASHKIEAGPIHKQVTPNSTFIKHKATASVTYQTIRPFHEKQQVVITTAHKYVIFSPKAIQPEQSYLPTDNNQSTSFYDVSFFEKAMLFNDKLQTLIK